MFKKSILVAVALTFVGAPLAQARDYQPLRKAEQHRYEPNRPSYGKQYKKPNEQRYYKKWSKGQRYGDWRAIRKCVIINVTACVNRGADSIG